MGPEHLCFSAWSHTCDNGVLEPEEQCDGDDFGGGDATSFGCKDGDTLICLERVCRVYCTRCGNGRLELTPSGSGEQCDDGNTADGDGCSGACKLETCGNAVVDPSEDCDDGNISPGDGCSPACRREECGNGIIDYETGEHCDDGNRLSLDGCASDCTVEFPTWARWTSPLETPRELHAMAYDGANDRLVLFGGSQASSCLNDTWAYDGERWRKVRSPQVPSPRRAVALEYDPVGQRILLFGGMSQDGEGLSDLWVLDGESWELLEPAARPGPRAGAAAAWDDARGRLVVFGGATAYNGQLLGDSWAYDGVGWTPIMSDATPLPRAAGRLAYDPDRRRLVLFGGHDLDLLVMDDTWELDGDVWIPMSPTHRPPGRSMHSLTWHSGLGGLVVHGGTDYQTTFLDDTWVYDGVDWSVFSPDATPLARAGHAAAWHPMAGRLVIHGGTGAGDYADSWALSPIGWAPLPASYMANPRIDAAATYDLRRGVLVLFGGYDNLGPRGDTWEFDGDSWNPSAADASSPKPTPRMKAALAYDEEEGLTILFGGAEAEGDTADTWAHDGLVWRQLAPPTSPPMRAGHVMVYDPNRKRIVLFGGRDGLGHYYSDTWELDVAAERWEQNPTPVFPTARYHPSLVWDRTRQAAVLFGGNLPSEMLDDTWFYRDGQWVPLISDRRPSARAQALLVYDKSRQRVLLHGGSSDFAIPGENGLSDTWELRDDGWYRLSAIGAPPPREAMSWAWDEHRRRTVLIGGIPGAKEVWELRYQGFSTLEDCANALDDDSDTLVDCLDPDCAWDPICGALP